MTEAPLQIWLAFASLLLSVMLHIRRDFRINSQALRRLVVVAVNTTWIVGCGLIVYSEPDSGPLARVRFVNESNGVVSGLRQYDDNNCDTGEREVARFSSGLLHNHKSIGIPGNSPDIRGGQKTEIHVRAEQPFYGVYWSSSTLPSECRIAFEFVPEADRDYQVTFHWNLYRPNSCSATLAQVGEQGVTLASRSVAMPTGRCIAAVTKRYLD